MEEPADSSSLRRTARVSVRNVMRDEKDVQEADGYQPPGDQPRLRQTRKRKIIEGGQILDPPLDNLIDETLRPLSAEDIQDWEGWVELESEPAFFNIILRDLGIQNIMAQELFGLDEDSLGALSQPVFGLIFLFEYVPRDETEVVEDIVPDLWFANQTMNNACATIALLNIVMNAEDLDLGDQLRQLKNQSRHMSSPVRGHLISTNPWIRAIHNSFTRRMDHLNADLCLEIEQDKAARKNRTTSNKTKKRASRHGKAKNTTEYGFHFIAYLPSNGYVWELDGLKSQPQKLDEIQQDHDWTDIVQPHIQARMAEYEEEQVSFNLLALCRSPLAALSRAVLEQLAALRHLHIQAHEGLPHTKIPALPAFDFASCLAECQLEQEAINRTFVPDWVTSQTRSPEFDANKALVMQKRISEILNQAMYALRSGQHAASEDENKVEDRRGKDYAPAIHTWLKKLAEKEVLEGIINESL